MMSWCLNYVVRWGQELVCSALSMQLLRGDAMAISFARFGIHRGLNRESPLLL